MTSLADDVIETGNLPPDTRDDFVERIHQAAHERRFTMAHHVRRHGSSPVQALTRPLP
jgi:hypothetical protein